MCLTLLDLLVRPDASVDVTRVNTVMRELNILVPFGFIGIGLERCALERSDIFHSCDR